MIIAVSSSGKDSNSLLDPRFGRCRCFGFYDTERDAWDFKPNPGALEGSGAGVRAAQFLIEQNAEVLLTGDVGPNASRILNSSGIEIYSFPEVALQDALKDFQEGRCRAFTEAAAVPPEKHHHTRRKPQQQVGSSPSSAIIAVATDSGEVAQHFGRCPEYTLVEIKDGVAADERVIASPGHQPGFLPRFLSEKGANCIIAGGMGPRAHNIFAELGISAITGVTGPVKEVIEHYLAGRLVGGESLCEHGHGGGRECDDH